MADWTFPKGDLMKGKRGLIMGVANDKSIAWGIAQQLAAQGADIAFTYQGEALERRVRPLIESIGMNTMISADVTNDAEMDTAFAQLKEKYGSGADNDVSHFMTGRRVLLARMCCRSVWSRALRSPRIRSRDFTISGAHHG